MRKFIVDLFSNRFGIVLAVLHVCYFLSRPYFQRVFAHEHGEDCVVIRNFFLFPINISNTDDLMIAQNLPAMVLTSFPDHLIKEIFPQLCVYTQINLQIVFFVFFIVIQWLFVAWFARTLSILPVIAKDHARRR